MEPYVPHPGDRVFVPFGESHTRAGERGVVTYYGPKESPDELKKLFEENPEAPKPVQFPAVTFEDSDPQDANEWIDLSRIRPYSFPAYVISYLVNAMRAVRILAVLRNLSIAALVVAAAYYGNAKLREIRNVQAAAQAEVNPILALGKQEAETAQARALLLAAQRVMKVDAADLAARIAENVAAVKELDMRIAKLRAEAMRLVNAPKDAPVEEPKK